MTEVPMPMTTDNSKPYVSNYPPLKQFLDKMEARCVEQLPIGNARTPVAYLEKWAAPNGRTFVIEVRANRMGWEIYTGIDSGLIAETLTDAESRLSGPIP
jgi:hypothetical protein